MFEIAARTLKTGLYQGSVKVSTGVMQLEKLSAGDASNRNPKTNAEDNLALAA
jgi:hypothetical protein